MACEEDADFDEDVILPNSPLGCYVKGLENTEVNNLFDECFSSEDRSQEIPKFLPEEKKIRFVSVKEHLLNVYEICIRFSSFLFALPVYFMIELSDMKHCFSIIKNYSILINEDEVFLKSWISEYMHHDGKGQSDKYKRICLKLILIFITVFSSLAMYYIIIEYSSFSILIQVLSVLFFLVFITSILFCSVLSIELALGFHINSLSYHTTNIFVLIKKSFRLIQEAELIARGFTAASVIGAAEHIELSSRLPINSCSRQYSELRKRLFSWMKNIFLKYKTKTAIILQRISLDPEIDIPTCLASLNIEEFGGLLNFEIDSPELAKVTDNFSISALKTMYHLMEMQVSEFFKYMVVISSLASDNRPKDWKHLNYAKCLKSNVISLAKDMRSFSEKIKYSYYYYQSIEATYTDDHDTSQPETKIDKSNLQIAVHSMTLHLKAALFQLIHIENDLNFSNILGNKTKSVETFRSALKIIKSEVSAFEDNFNESQKILNDVLNPDQTSTPDAILSIPKEQNSHSIHAVIEKCDIEREIADEVFEDTISNKEINALERDFFHDEEVKDNVEMASHLLKELKNVLVVKADEHKAREELALAKKSKEINQAELNENRFQTPEEAMKIDNYRDQTGEKFDSLTLLQKDTSDPSKKVKNINTIVSEINQMCPDDNRTSRQFLSDVFPLDLEESELEQICFNDVEEESELSLKETASSVQKELSGEFCFIPSRIDSFAANIASAAAERQKLLGLKSEEFIDGTDESDSDDA